MTDPTRRRVLAGLVAAGFAAAGAAVWQRRRAPGDAAMPHGMRAPSHAPAASLEPGDARFARPLRLASAQGLMAGVALATPVRLQARRAAFDVFGDPSTEVWHYADRASGAANPLLVARRGQRVDVELHNALAEPTTLHWHGLHVDEHNDGSGLHPVLPGASTRYAFELRNRAGLYWYHAHPHGRTGAQLHAGLAGLLKVEDDEDEALNLALGLEAGARDIPLMLADKQVDPRHALHYRDGADDWIGNRLLVNWTPEPHLDVARTLYRFRLVNACNARLLRPAFVHEGAPLPMQLIGTDGGLLAQAYALEDLFLAPAQRADVLVDFSALPAGARVRLRSLEYVAMEQEDESGGFIADPMAEHPGAHAMGEALDMMELRVGASEATRHTGRRAHPPARLSDLPPPPDTTGWPVRSFRLRTDESGAWCINDWNMHRQGMAPVFEVQRGTREVWEIRNSMTSMPHPMHLHGFQARVVSRTVSPPDIRARAVAANGLTAQDMGCSDTVLVWPGEVVRLAIDFSQPFSGTQRYMLHCHNLEHEDMGMMLTFAVVDGRSSAANAALNDMEVVA